MSSSSTSTHARDTASSLPLLSGEKLERRLEELLQPDRFAPPPHFVAAESVNASVYARAELDPNAFWAEQARELHWDEPFTTVLDDSNPPFYKWFTDGKLNVSYNCLDRHVEAAAATGWRSIGPARRVNSARSPTPSYIATYKR